MRPNRFLKNKQQESRSILGLYVEMCRLGSGFQTFKALRLNRKLVLHIISRRWMGGSPGNQLRQNFQDWELEEVIGLLAILDGRELKLGQVVAIRWKEQNSGMFTIKSYSQTLQGERHGELLWRSIWRIGSLRKWLSFIERLCLVRFSPKIFFLIKSTLSC